MGRAKPATRANVGLRTRSARPSAQQAIPDSEAEQDNENADYKKRRRPAVRLRLPADADHYAGDVIGTAGLGAPKAVAIGVEHKLAPGVRATRLCDLARIAGREYAYLGIDHR